MGTNRKRYSAKFKAKAALEAYRGVKTLPELAKEFGVHPTQISQWKQHLGQQAATLFGKSETSSGSLEHETSRLYEQIGRLQMELEWLKKFVELPMSFCRWVKMEQTYQPLGYKMPSKVFFGL